MAEFKNPQQEPGAERRLLLVFVLTFVVLIIFQPLLKKFFPQPPAAPQPQTQNQPVPAQPAAASSAQPRPHRPPPPSIQSPSRPPPKPKPSSRTISTKSPSPTAAPRSNPGSSRSSTTTPRTACSISSIPPPRKNSATRFLSGPTTRPCAIASTRRSTYLSNEGNLSAPAQITFEYADQDLVVRKTFRFDHTYVLNVETSVIYKGAEVFAAPAWPAGFGDEATPASYAAARIDYHSDASTDRTALVFPNFVLRLPVKSISGGNTIKGPFEWAGTGDQYFTAIFIPDDPTAAAMVTLRNSMEIAQKPG